MISLPKNCQKGFTLLEMAVSISIFGIISAVVIFNHGKFNSSIVVTNLSYEVALAVREAQVYGLAVKQDPTEAAPVEYAYGVYFSTETSGSKKRFFIFADKDGNQQFDPTGDPCNGTDECQEIIEIRGDVNVEALRTEISGTYQPTDELTVLFLRPNPVAIIRDEANSSSGVSGRERAMIELSSPRAEKSKFILIELSGQVSVVDES